MLLGLLRELNKQYAIHRADEEQSDIRDLPDGQIWPSSRRPAGYNEDFSPAAGNRQGDRNQGRKVTDSRLERLEFLLKQLRAVRYRLRHQSIRTKNMKWYETRERELLRQIDLIKSTVSPYMYLDLDRP